MSDAPTTTGKRSTFGLSVGELKRLKGLEDESRRLKQIVADHAFNVRALKELLSKNF